MAKRPCVPPRVSKRDVAQLESVWTSRQRRGRRLPGGAVLCGDIEVQEQVGHEQRVLVHRADRGQDSLKAPLSLAKDGEVESHVPQGDLGCRRAAGDEQITAVERGEREQAEEKSPNHPAHREPTILVKKFFEQRPISAQNQGG